MCEERYVSYGVSISVGDATAASTTVVPGALISSLDRIIIRRWRKLEKEAQWEQGSGGPCKGDNVTLHLHTACVLSPDLCHCSYAGPFNSTKSN